MGGLSSVRSEAGSPAHDHGQHSSGHAGHRADGDALVHEADAGPPIGVPHAPAQCVLTMGCGSAAVAAAVAIDASTHDVRRVDIAVALAHDSPALALEPPPPRV